LNCSYAQTWLDAAYSRYFKYLWALRIYN